MRRSKQRRFALALTVTAALLLVIGFAYTQLASSPTSDATLAANTSFQSEPADGGVTRNESPTELKQWQEREAPAYVPVERDTETWRSVRMPPAHVVEELLTDRGKVALDASQADIDRAVTEWYERARKDAYVGPDPLAFRRLMEREETLLNSKAGSDTDVSTTDLDPPDDDMLESPQKNLLAVVVEFTGTDTISRTYPVDPDDPSLGCSEQEFTWGPLGLGEDPPPGPRDNFSFYQETFTVEDYQEAFFGTGPDAGYGVVRPDLGGIDLSGYTLQNYLLEMSNGEYTAGGAVLTATVKVPHSHEYYGYAQYAEDGDGNCVAPTFSDANYNLYVPDVIDAIVDQYGDSIDWSQFDADDDQIIDLLVTIHAGYGFQNGGGEDRLSTSSSGFFGELPQIGGLSTPDDTSDDYYVQGFNVDPEQLDVGAIQEEFEHQFGLPDIYVIDGANSNAFWGAHSSGVWGGELGATRPVGHNLWQDWLLGWRNPMIIDYDTEPISVTLGRARYKPDDTEDGVIVKLPPEEIEVPNNAGTGIGWWSQSGDLMDNRVYRDFDLTDASGQIVFAFDAYWDIEEDWDYGFIEVSTDGGDTWTTIPDMDGVLRDSNPNGNNLGWGLTATGDQRLRFDLSSYAGQTIGIRLRYKTDPAVSNPGWWVDNLSLEDDSGVLYSNDLESDFSDWTNEGWLVVPYTETNDRFYLFEWRDDNGFDESLNDPYLPVWSNPDEPPPEVEVDRLPATTPGMTVSFRDTGEGFDYTLSDSLFDPPTIGPKYGLLVIDSHFEPVRFDTTFAEHLDGWVGYDLYGRAKAGHAAFGLTPTNEWTARLGLDVDAGEYVTPVLETKTWASMPPEPAFHDSYGYYPGYFYPGGAFVYLHDWDASSVVPAKGPYSTRVTMTDTQPMTDLYGIPFGPSYLGTGNPGDDHVQFGLHAEVLDAADDDSWARVKIWNSLYEVETAVDVGNVVFHGDTYETSYRITKNIGGALENPLVIVEVPSNTHYIWGTAYGGLQPIVASDVSSAQDAASYIASVGFDDVVAQAESLRTADVDPIAENVRYLAWSGEDIATKMGSPEFGYVYKANAIAGGVGSSQVTYFRNYDEPFQTDTATVSIVPVAQQFLPVFASLP